jgi:hypothetical protein
VHRQTDRQTALHVPGIVPDPTGTRRGIARSSSISRPESAPPGPCGRNPLSLSRSRGFDAARCNNRRPTYLAIQDVRTLRSKILSQHARLRAVKSRRDGGLPLLPPIRLWIVAVTVAVAILAVALLAYGTIININCINVRW